MALIKLGNSTGEAPSQRVSAYGWKDANIILLGEAPGAREVELGQPFVGPSGQILDQCLSAAGLLRSQCYITNVIKERPRGNDISPFFQERKGFTELAQPYLNELREELEQHPAKIIVALGRVAMCALIGMKPITPNRGYAAYVRGGPVGTLDKITIPTFHPSNVVRGQAEYKYIISYDLIKAKKRLDSRNFAVEHGLKPILTSNCGWAREAIAALKSAPIVACDLECTPSVQISHLGLASTSLAISIEFDSRLMSLSDEIDLWLDIGSLLSDPRIEKAFQHGMFDIPFLYLRNRILTRGKLHDSMVYWSIMNPDFPKSLGFIASLALDVPEWKTMVSWRGSDHVKRDS